MGRLVYQRLEGDLSLRTASLKPVRRLWLRHIKVGRGAPTRVEAMVFSITVLASVVPSKVAQLKQSDRARRVGNRPGA